MGHIEALSSLSAFTNNQTLFSGPPSILPSLPPSLSLLTHSCAAEAEGGEQLREGGHEKIDVQTDM